MPPGPGLVKPWFNFFHLVVLYNYGRYFMAVVDIFYVLQDVQNVIGSVLMHGFCLQVLWMVWLSALLNNFWCCIDAVFSAQCTRLILCLCLVTEAWSISISFNKGNWIVSSHPSTGDNVNRTRERKLWEKPPYYVGVGLLWVSADDLTFFLQTCF